MRMRCMCLVINAPDDLQVVEQDAGELGPGQVLVQVGFGGICGSDLHYFHHGGFGTVRIKRPMILGHEVAGVIEAVGAAVQGFAVGQRVAVVQDGPAPGVVAGDGLALVAAHHLGLDGHTAGDAGVELEGDALAFDGTTGKGAFSLDSTASAVSVDIIGKNGETLDTLNLGAREAGQHGFEWPAGSIDPDQVAKFSVRATNGSTTVTDTELQRVRIASVGLSNGAMNIQLANGRTLAYDQVRGFM